MPPSALDLARDLIRCPSVTPADAGALGVIERALSAGGFKVQRITFSAPGTADVDNLFASFGAGAPHLVLAGHSDVVPPGDAARWSRDPFGADVADGLLYGRGAVDMKGGLAAMLAAALEMVAARGGALPGTLSVLVTGDEEGPSINGMPKLLAFAHERGARFDHCLLAEPTSVEALGDTLKIGRRGSLSGVLTLEGVQGHVAYPHRAANPMRHLNRILGALMDVPLDRESAHFERSNCEVVSIDTGNPAFNIIPAQVTVRFNVRFNDHWTLDSLKEHVAARIAAAAEETRFTVAWAEGAAESFLTQPGPFVDLVSRAVETVTGTAPKLSTGGGTSDARFIKDQCPVVELGLVGTSMHQVDEATPVADLEGLTRIYRAIFERYFGG